MTNIEELVRTLNPERRYVFRDLKLYMVAGRWFPKTGNKPVYEVSSVNEAERVKEALWRRGFVVDFEDRYEGKLRWMEEAEAA